MLFIVVEGSLNGLDINMDIKLSTLQPTGPIYAILLLMKQYDFISPQEIERLAFIAHIGKNMLGASGLRLLGQQRYYEEVADYLESIKKAMHRIERSSIKSGLHLVEVKVKDESKSTRFRQGVSDARSKIAEHV